MGTGHWIKGYSVQRMNNIMRQITYRQQNDMCVKGGGKVRGKARSASKIQEDTFERGNVTKVLVVKRKREDREVW